MSQQQFVLLVLGALLGSGGLASINQFRRYKTDTASAVAIGAEAAVQSLLNALTKADSRIETLEHSLQVEHDRANQLEVNLDAALRQVRAANVKAEALEAKVGELTHLVESLQVNITTAVQVSEEITDKLAVTEHRLDQVEGYSNE